MKKIILGLRLIGGFCYVSAQSNTHTYRHFPAASFERNNTIISGISYGLGRVADTPRHTKTRGFRLELFGEGFVALFYPASPIAVDDSSYKNLLSRPPSEKVSGINISGFGSLDAVQVAGISVAGIAQILPEVSGIAAAPFSNSVQKMNGAQLAFSNNISYVMNGLQVSFSNYAVKLKGVQIGIFNESHHTRGLQFGLWNKNERRKWPVVNWNFSSRNAAHRASPSKKNRQIE